MKTPWDEKLLSAIEDSSRGTQLRGMFRSFAPASLEIVEELQTAYPFITADYAHFLSITDGASVWMFELFGSGNTGMQPLSQLRSRWHHILGELHVFAFCESPEGDCIAMQESGEIIQFNCWAESATDYVTIAPSFGTFLGDGLLGTGFCSLCRLSESDQRDHDWLNYLRGKGWLS